MPASRSGLRVPAALAALAVLAVPSAGAATLVPRSELADLTLEQLSNLVVTSVSRREERLSDAAASVYVITAQDIRDSGATTIAQALRLAPNLNVARGDNTQYAISARGFNNVIANKMLVLIDGRTVYTPLFSGVFWEAQDTLIEDIERIEVISGPGATLWGANAVNGVINVITRPARDTQGLLVSALAGTSETNGALRYGGVFAQGHFRGYFKSDDRGHTERADGSDVRDAQWIRQTGFRIDWTQGAWRDLTVQGDAYESSVEQPGPSRIFSGHNLLARYNRQLAGGSLHIQVYLDQARRHHPDFFRERLRTYDIEAHHGFAAGPHRILWGAGYRRSQDAVENTAVLALLPANRSLTGYNLFFQDQLALRDDLETTLGMKVEHNPYTGSEVLPNARLAWRWSSEGLLWGSLSRAVRAPSRLEREVFFPGAPPFALVGTNAFDSEVSEVLELGLRSRAASAWQYSITAFHHEHDKLRSLRRASDGVVRFANDIDGHTSGLEGWARWQPHERWQLQLGGTRMDQRVRVKPGAVDAGGLALLGNDPEYWLKARASWTLSPRHDLDVSLRHYGPLPNPAVPRYTAVDARLAWRPSRSVEVSLTVQNLFGRDHAEWGVDGERTVFQRAALLKLTWRP